jgi:hypothetical protein
VEDVVVWQPPTDRPADDDWAVQLRLASYRRMRMYLIAVAAVLVVLTGSAVVLFAAGGSVGGFSIAEVVALVSVVAWLGDFHQRYGRFNRSVRAVTGDFPAVRVQAEFLGRDVLSVDSGRLFLRLRNATWGQRQVIARIGLMWLVGPDAHGAAVVFADGMPMPVSASVVETPERSEVEPVGGDLPLWRAKQFVWLQGILFGLMLAWFAGVEMNLVTKFRWWSLPGPLLILMLLVVVFAAVDIPRPVRLVRRGGDWQVYPVTVGQWLGNPRPYGDLGLMMTLPNGIELPVAVRMASVELVANVLAAEQLWVLGQPQAGNLTAVGLPGYPIAASARYVRKAKLHG